MKQSSIKADLDISFLKTKVNLLEETLNSKTKDLETLEAFKENNTHLLSLLDKYDDKLSQMQDDIDVRDLKINELIDKYEHGETGKTPFLITYRNKFGYCRIKGKIFNWTTRKV